MTESSLSTARLGGVLREIPEIQELGTAMESLFHRAEQLSASITDAARSAEHFKTLKIERDRINDKLAAIGTGEEVVGFLLAVAWRSATLAQVTGEVRAWLDERNSLGRFKVGLW